MRNIGLIAMSNVTNQPLPDKLNNLRTHILTNGLLF